MYVYYAHKHTHTHARTHTHTHTHTDEPVSSFGKRLIALLMNTETLVLFARTLYRTVPLLSLIYLSARRFLD